jgi:hypothetical protein
MKERFDNLSMDDKAILCWDGTFIESIRYYGYAINLYALNKQLSGYYAEVYINCDNEIEKIELCDEQSLKKFWSRVNINEGMN